MPHRTRKPIDAEAREQIASMADARGETLAPRHASLARDLGVEPNAVVVHRDASARRAADALAVPAFTIGNHVALPEGVEQRAGVGETVVLGHELSHVVQQATRVSAASLRDEPLRWGDPSLERDATGIAAPTARGIGACVQGFEGYEHEWIGDELVQGMGPRFIRLPCHDDLPLDLRGLPWQQWPEGSPFRKLIERQPAKHRALAWRVATKGLTYGQMNALAGDFYESLGPDGTREQDPTNAVPRAAASRAQSLAQAPLAEVVELCVLIAAHASTTDFQKATGGRFLELAKKNTMHFTSATNGAANALDAYRHHHAHAIRAAHMGMAHEAWALNAFADHFLADMFAAGHLRTRRDSSSLLRGALNRFSHNVDNRKGLSVMNRRGDRWFLQGDDQLHVSQRPAVLRRDLRILREAMMLSRSDVGDALAAPKGLTVPPEPTPPRFPAIEELLPMADPAMGPMPDPEPADYAQIGREGMEVAKAPPAYLMAMEWIEAHAAVLERSPERIGIDQAEYLQKCLQQKGVLTLGEEARWWKAMRLLERVIGQKSKR